MLILHVVDFMSPFMVLHHLWCSVVVS